MAAIWSISTVVQSSLTEILLDLYVDVDEDSWVAALLLYITWTFKSEII